MSGPGERAPKLRSSRDSTHSHTAQDQGVPPRRVEVVDALSPEAKEFGTLRTPLAREPGDLEGARGVGHGRCTEETDKDVVNGQIRHNLTG
jgi:hypothetical protein